MFAAAVDEATRPHRLRPSDQNAVMASADEADHRRCQLLCRALKVVEWPPPSNRFAAERARSDGSTREEFLAACLEHEVAAKRQRR